ncbi:hypothetical protein BC629DRAFT_1582989 [Irpex lacteus]|nr:hypothetical protein BC629DRAFT_1582989 [Irpex lacteus]
MPLTQASSALHLKNATPGFLSAPGRTPTSVTVHPVALFTILDHYLRRTDAQERVIGTLLGTRSDTGEIEVRSAFAVLHSETAEQVAVDMDYHHQMYELHHKVNSKEVSYSTGSNLNTYSALIQNFYTQETARIRPYILHSIRCRGSRRPESRHTSGSFTMHAIRCNSPYRIYLVHRSASHQSQKTVYSSHPVELRFSQQERSGREFSSASSAIQPLIDLQLLVVDLLSNVASGSSDAFPATDLDILERALESVTEMLDRVLSYVRSVLAGEVKGDAAVGRYLFDTFGASTEELEKGAFNSSLQDTLMVSYLANLVRSQAEVSSRLALTRAS